MHVSSQHADVMCVFQRLTCCFVETLIDLFCLPLSLVLEKGQVVESGSHADLMVRKGKYYELAKGQMLS